MVVVFVMVFLGWLVLQKCFFLLLVFTPGETEVRWGDTQNSSVNYQVHCCYINYFLEEAEGGVYLRKIPLSDKSFI